MGQMMSVRPDVLPQPALVELAKMQDGVEGFEQSIAIAMVEQELGNDPNPDPDPDPDPDPKQADLRFEAEMAGGQGQGQG